ncbi:MAG: hypothetical protein HZC42_00815 [Candidatus Eisenbacteria bacterium]|nr:hypothetical protein [Candidatus Eisenbacteria bacterium]
MKTLATPVATALAAISLLASAAARTPTNDAAAFRTFDLYADRTAAVNVVDHVNVSGYPSYLVSNSLLVTRTPGSSDTVALFNSEPHDGVYFEVNGSHPQSYVEYAVTPPQFATSLGFLAMGVIVFNGTGAFNDFGKPLLRATVTYADGDTAIRTLHVGNHVREYLDSDFSCNFVNIPLYTTRPSDPLSGYIYEDGTYFYDVQEQLLPQSKRSKRAVSIRIDGVVLDHFCSTWVPHIYAGSDLFGVSLWPNFAVRNALNQPVVRQSQVTGRDHGGYLFGSTVVGTRRRTDRTACQVASQAMSYTYAGFACTVDSLNAHLQRSRGYEPDRVAVVTFVSPSGDAIRYTAAGQSKLNVDDEFLVEHGTYTNPLATYRVTVAGRNGQAVRVAVHNATVPSIGDLGQVYWKMIPRIADAYTQSPQLRSGDLYDSPQLAARVESLLVREIPVQLNVGARGGHFVVASGWTSSFRPDGSARGTYSIKDPFDDRNYTKLIEGKYRNTFTMARYVVPVGGPGPLLADSAAAVTVGTAGLVVLASGARRVEIIDPLGRRMLRDAGSGEAIYEIPEAAIEDLSSEHDNGGDVDDPLTGYDLQIPTALDGNYTVRVYADDGLSLSASAYDASGVFASDAAADTSVGPTGNTYRLAYSAAGQSIVVTWLGAVGVESTAPTGPSLLTVRTNPTTGPVEFVIAGAGTAGDAIEIFDIGGRRVDALDVAPGRQVVSWYWTRAGCRPGVYLARLRSGNAMVRFVVVR